MRGGEVDPVPGDAVLRGYREAGGEEPVAYGDLERVKGRCVAPCLAEVGTAGAGVPQVVAQHLHTRGAGSLRCHVVVAERADQSHAAASTGDGDIEAALATFLEEGAESVGQPTVGALAVADGQNDRVAFIALDTLQVLDEEPFRVVLVEERRQMRVLSAGSSQSFVDAVGVFDSHGDDAE